MRCSAWISPQTNPLLGLVNDLSEKVKSRVRLFADDTAAHLAITKAAVSKE